MNKLKAGSCCISDLELTEALTSQATLTLVQRKGAPVVGAAILQLSGQYRWYVTDNLKDLCTEFHWEPKD